MGRNNSNRGGGNQNRGGGGKGKAMKYEIRADIKVNGTVQRKDIIGAIMGQTEGLLGDELELRKLQRTARVGHVDVEMETKNGKVHGTIVIPSRSPHGGGWAYRRRGVLIKLSRARRAVECTLIRKRTLGTGVETATTTNAAAADSQCVGCVTTIISLRTSWPKGSTTKLCG